MTYTAESIIALLSAAGYQEVNVTVCNETVTLHPCMSYDNKTLEYILVYSPSLPWLGGNPAQVADQLNSYGQLLEQKASDIQRLAEMKQRLLHPAGMTPDEWEDTFGFYSDWYKDVHGVRPRDIVRPSFAAF